jgi:hypothetical protein
MAGVYIQFENEVRIEKRPCMEEMQPEVVCRRRMKILFNITTWDMWGTTEFMRTEFMRTKVEGIRLPVLRSSSATEGGKTEGENKYVPFAVPSAFSLQPFT